MFGSCCFCFWAGFLALLGKQLNKGWAGWMYDSVHATSAFPGCQLQITWQTDCPSSTTLCDLDANLGAIRAQFCFLEIAWLSDVALPVPRLIYRRRNTCKCWTRS